MEGGGGGVLGRREGLLEALIYRRIESPAPTKMVIGRNDEPAGARSSVQRAHEDLHQANRAQPDQDIDPGNRPMLHP